MSHYKYAPHTTSNILEASEESITAWEEEAKKIDADNRLIYAQLKVAHRELVSTTINIFGVYSKEAKYIQKTSPPEYPIIDVTFVRSQVKKIKDAKEAKEKHVLEEYNAQYAAGCAISYMIAEGNVFGVHFQASNAVTCATQYAFEKELARRLAELEETGDLISFDGQNCDDCDGWDGFSNRCACGNRRVSWEPDYSHSFLNPSIIGSAH